MKDLEQAARQALEALEQHGSAYLGHETPYSAAISALRQAIEQPKQEPAAWCRSDTVADWKGQILNVAYMFPSPKGLKNPIPLYTEPPKREWVGLTAADLAEIPANCYEGAIWADAKLKEKNT